MTFRLPLISRILSVLFLLAVVVSAQETEVNEPLDPDRIKAMRSERAMAADEGSGKEGAGAKWANMTPEERLNASMRRGAKAHCTFVTACMPPKLLPGQTGTLRISAVMRGDSVLPAPLNITMTPRTSAEAVALGNLVAQPAVIGTNAEAYIGRPVYENTAVFEVPVTMGSAAKLGSKQSVLLDLQFDLFSGKSGQAVGRFIESVSAEIEVAPHVDPAVSGRTEPPKAASEAVAPLASVDSSDATDPSGRGVQDDAMAGVANEVPSEVPGEASDSAAPNTGSAPEASPLPNTYSEGGFPWMLVGGGGAFLLIIVLLVMRKK